MTPRTKKPAAGSLEEKSVQLDQATGETGQPVYKPEDDRTLNPQPYISRMTFRLGATVPTGDYANLTPSIEVTYDVPEGATPPAATAVLDELRGAIVDAVYPMIIEQTNKIHLTVKMMQASDDEQGTIRKALSASPLFLWLSTIDPISAAMIVGHRLESYEEALERAQKELAARQAAAQPKNPHQ